MAASSAAANKFCPVFHRGNAVVIEILPISGRKMVLSAALCGLLLAAHARAQSPERRAALACDVEKELRAELANYYPRTIDSAGGFYVSFRNDWSRYPETSRTTVSQGRLTWTAAEVSRRRPDLQKQYAQYALHGVRYLRDVMWDKQHGGFFWAVTPDDGSPQENGEKHLYSNAFGLYGAAAAYRATLDSSALELAKKTFQWIEHHGHDDKFGGYFEAFTRDGTPLLQSPNQNKIDLLGTLYGYKSMNAHIHLLEAYTELYHVWPDQMVKTRIIELIGLVKDKMFVEPGCLHMQYTRDWRPLPGPNSYGHDIETTFLLDEAEEAIGQRDPEVAIIGKKLADHALEFGWDTVNGGLYFEGAGYGGTIDTRKEWWAQAETANTLLLLAQKNSDSQYADYFAKQWAFITKYQIDRVHGGWHQAVSADGKTVVNKAKSHGWKLAYHNGRAMLNIADRLKAMSEEQKKSGK